MSTGLPARVAVVCTLIFGAAIARAQPGERRPVAVIDLTDDPINSPTDSVGNQLHGELNDHPVLKQLDDPRLAYVLLGAGTVDDHAERAQRARAQAEDQLARDAFGRAAEYATEGAAQLHLAVPTPRVTGLYAQLAFVLGQTQLGQSNPRGAAASFALAHRLDPVFVPDAARYLPEVVRAFELAKNGPSGKGTIDVTGSGRVWLDGKQIGVAPGEFPATAGPHVVWLTGDDRLTRAAQVTVLAGKKIAVKIADAPASAEVKVGRARAALRAAWPDATARAGAMKKLVGLLGVHDAVLLTSVNGKIVVQTWSDAPKAAMPGFSALRELKRGQKPIDLLTPLAPKPRKAEPEDIALPPFKPPPEKPWWRKGSYQVGMGAGVVAAIIGSVFLVRAINGRPVLLGRDAKVDGLDELGGVGR